MFKKIGLGMALLCVNFICILLSLAKNVEHDGWKVLYEKDQIKVEAKKDNQTKLLMFRAQGILQAPLDSIMANLRDVNTSTEWQPQLIMRKEMVTISDVRAITLSENDVPWPFSNRTLLLDNELKFSPDQLGFIVISESTKDQEMIKKFPVESGKVMAEMIKGVMTLKYKGPKESFVAFDLMVDPKGHIPTFVVNIFTKEVPFKFLKSLEKRANTHPMKLNPTMQKMYDTVLNNVTMKKE